MARADDSLEDIANIVRTLRKGLHQTQAEFATELGIAQATVSQYENGLTIPSTEILLKMNVLSEGMDVRAAVNRQINRRFASEKESEEHFFKSVGKDIRISPTWPRLRTIPTEFSDEVTAFLTKTNPLTFEVSTDLVRILRLYREHYAAAGSRAAFRKAADYLEVELKQPPAKDSPAPASKGRGGGSNPGQKARRLKESP